VDVIKVDHALVTTMLKGIPALYQAALAASKALECAFDDEGNAGSELEGNELEGSASVT
jgi:hypothetical protein